MESNYYLDQDWQHTFFMKKTLLFLLLLLSTLSFGQTKELYDKRGDSLIALGQYDAVITYFDKELQKHPKNEQILRWLGYVHITKKNWDLGEKYYKEALGVNPACAWCYNNIGKIYSFRGDYDKALDYYNKAIKTDPKDASLYMERGDFKVYIDDNFGASQDYDKAIELDPGNSDYYRKRGMCNSISGYQSLALTDMSKAIELSPQNAEALFDRSSINYTLRNLDEALKDINRAIDLDSTQFTFYTGRGAVLDALGDYPKAIADYSKAIALNQSDYVPYLNRAAAYYRLELLDASCADYNTLRSFIKNDAINDPSAIKEINTELNTICDSSVAGYYYQRGVGFYNLKEYQKAVGIYTKGLKKFLDNGLMHSFKANAHLALREYAKAIESYNLALQHKNNILEEFKKNPRFSDSTDVDFNPYLKGALADIHYSLAECKVNLDQYNEALIDINKALELLPDLKGLNKETYYNLRGYIYLMKGKYEQAISEFNQSISLNRNFTLAYVNRAVAKVSAAEKIKVTSYSIGGSLNSQPTSINWKLPMKSTAKSTDTAITSALFDCSAAIEIDNKLGFAYYIRGQIKQMLAHSDYCIDLLTAKTLNMTVEEDLLINCGK